tara:strand:- start:321 stop:791 length:471 start_codon:yes stop_codon:yes gene_type:complete
MSKTILKNEKYIYEVNPLAEIIVRETREEVMSDGEIKEIKLRYAPLLGMWGEERREFERAEYRGPIPFNLEEGELGVNSGTYFISRSGGWLNNRMSSVSSSLEQKLTFILLKRVKEFYDENESKMDPDLLFQFDPATLTTQIVYPNQKRISIKRYK